MGTGRRAVGKYGGVSSVRVAQNGGSTCKNPVFNKDIFENANCRSVSNMFSKGEKLSVSY